MYAEMSREIQRRTGIHAQIGSAVFQTMAEIIREGMQRGERVHVPTSDSSDRVTIRQE